jgi:hypothetical protein
MRRLVGRYDWLQLKRRPRVFCAAFLRALIEGALRPTVMAVTIADEIAAEVTALAMGWVPVKGENGTRIWVRSKDIGVDNAPYCDTALEVVRTYTH